TAIAATPNVAPSSAPAVNVATAPTQNITAPPTPGVNSIKGSLATRPVVVGSTQLEANAKKPKSSYPLGITINNRGAAIDSVTLNRFRNQPEKPEPYVFQKPYEVSSPLAAALATRSISINGAGPIALDNIYWIP